MVQRMGENVNSGEAGGRYILSEATDLASGTLVPGLQRWGMRTRLFIGPG